MYSETPTCYGNRARRLAGVKALKILYRLQDFDRYDEPRTQAATDPWSWILAMYVPCTPKSLPCCLPMLPHGGEGVNEVREYRTCMLLYLQCHVV
jgi:hypothetical protein